MKANKLCIYKSEHFKFKGFGMIVGEYHKFYVVRWLLDHKIQIIAKKALKVL
jgi:hypothetical protein